MIIRFAIFFACLGAAPFAVIAEPPPDIAAAWSQRAEDADLHTLNRVQTVLNWCRQALNSNAHDSAARFLCIEANYFAGQFVAQTPAEQRAFFDSAVEQSAAAFAALAEAAHTPDLLSRTVAQQADAVRQLPDAAPTYFWGAITWGLFGMSHSMIASARNDVAGKIRDYALVLIEIDPKYANAGGYRLLGRLHALTPKVPLFSGWIDRTAALRHLRKAYEISQSDPRNALFLAEALLEFDPNGRDEALRLLNEVAGAAPESNYRTEERETIDAAKHRLAEIGKP